MKTNVCGNEDCEFFSEAFTSNCRSFNVIGVTHCGNYTTPPAPSEEAPESFFNPKTFHARTCRCNECDELHGLLKPKPREESDPDGIQQHEPGAKLDDGKLLAGLLQQWSRALTEVLKVSTFGAKKYSRGGWQHVKNGPERYTDAMFRHLLLEPVEPLDPDSGLMHEAHTAWNALSRLELMLREKEDK